MDLDLWDCLGRVKIGIIAKFHRTDLVIWSHSIGTNHPSYSRKNTVLNLIFIGDWKIAITCQKLTVSKVNLIGSGLISFEIVL